MRFCRNDSDHVLSDASSMAWVGMVRWWDHPSAFLLTLLLPLALLSYRTSAEGDILKPLSFLEVAFLSLKKRSQEIYPIFYLYP